MLLHYNLNLKHVIQDLCLWSVKCTFFKTPCRWQVYILQILVDNHWQFSTVTWKHLLLPSKQLKVLYFQVNLFSLMLWAMSFTDEFRLNSRHKTHITDLWWKILLDPSSIGRSRKISTFPSDVLFQTLQTKIKHLCENLANQLEAEEGWNVTNWGKKSVRNHSLSWIA